MVLKAVWFQLHLLTMTWNKVVLVCKPFGSPSFLLQVFILTRMVQLVLLGSGSQTELGLYRSCGSSSSRVPDFLLFSEAPLDVTKEPHHSKMSKLSNRGRSPTQYLSSGRCGPAPVSDRTLLIRFSRGGFWLVHVQSHSHMKTLAP